jgi:hypothetical protein
MSKQSYTKLSSLLRRVASAMAIIFISFTVLSCNAGKTYTFTFGPYGGITSPINITHRPNAETGSMTIGTTPQDLPYTLPPPHIVIPVILPDEGTIKAFRVHVLPVGGTGTGNLVTAALYRKAWDGALPSGGGQVIGRGYVTASYRGRDYTISVSELNEGIVDSNFYFLEVFGDRSLCGYFILGGFQVDVEMEKSPRYWRG